MEAKKKSVMLMLVTAFLWSLAGVFIKVIEWEPIPIVCVRCLAAAVTMWFFIRRQKIIWSWPLVGAAVSYAAFNYCYVVSTVLPTSANAVMMEYVAPVYVALLSGLLLKEKVRRADWLCLAAVLSGMLLFLADQLGQGSLAGYVISVGNGLAFAFFNIFLRMMKKGYAEQSVFLGGLLGFFVGLPFTVGQKLPDSRSMIVLLLAGAVVSIGYLLFIKASQNLTAVQAVMLPVIDPVLNPVWVWLAVGEVPGAVSLCGAAIVLAAITLRSLALLGSSEGELAGSDAKKAEKK